MLSDCKIMVLEHLKDPELLFELSSMDSAVEDDFLSWDPQDVMDVNGQVPIDDYVDSPACLTFLVYCDTSSKKVSKLVALYVKTLVKLYNRRDPVMAVTWRFAKREDSPTAEDTVPLFFYSSTFVKATTCCRALCESGNNAIFIVIDPTTSPEPEVFVQTAQQQLVGKNRQTFLLKLSKIQQRLMALSQVQRLKFASHVPVFENSQRLLQSVEAVLPLHCTTTGLEELLIEFPSKEFPSKMSNDCYDAYQSIPPLLDNNVLNNFSLQLDPLARPQKRKQFVARNEESEKQENKRKRKSSSKNCSKATTSINSMDSIPKRQFRVKGQIYVVNKIRKKWDGRQWRRLCQYKDCDHAARGSITFCVSHYKQQCSHRQTQNQLERQVPVDRKLKPEAPLACPNEARCFTAIKGEGNHVSLDLTKPLATIGTY